jgi:cytochrome c oxidase subunit 3
MEKDFRANKPQSHAEMEVQRDLELDPIVKEKMKKNLVYVTIFSIIMLFMAFTSAYIVSSGDSYWVAYPMPMAFWISTVLILLSSITLILAVKAAKKNNQAMLKGLISVTALLGIGFAVFQFKGYGQLVEKGAYFRSSLIVSEGRYGDYYEIKYNGTFLGVDGNNYTLNGKQLSKGQQEELVNFAKSVNRVSNLKPLKLSSLGTNIELVYQGNPVKLKAGKLMLSDTNEMQYVDLLRLQDLAVHMQDKRIDFFLDGKCGTDFHLYFKGKELQYVNRELLYNGKKLAYAMQTKLNSSSDQATSYLYIITFIHLLHVLAGIIYLFRLVLWTFNGRFSSTNTLSLRLGGIFWHFLGILWIYLLLFLLFIH